jgi:Fic family protein
MYKLNSYEEKALKEQLKIVWTYNSNAIEGNTLKLGDTAFVIEYGLTVKGKPLKEHNEVMGHARAIDLIYAFVKQDSFTEENLFLLHQAIMTQIIIDIEAPMGAYKVVENGRYLNIENHSTYLPYPHPNEIEHLMGLWFEDFGETKELQSFDECVELYTDMHLAFASIHPFFDGNGRLARLIANIPLLKSGFMPIIVNNEERQEYIELLSTYNLRAKPLDKSSESLIEKNEAYQALRAFFQEQYKNSQRLLDEIKGIR